MDQDKRLHQGKSVVSVFTTLTLIVHLATEEKNVYEERIASLNERINAQENELIQLGQDKK
jgi:hypothetical protein